MRRATLEYMASRSKDYWRQKREKEEWFRSVDIKYLFQLATFQREFEQFAKNNPNPTTDRLLSDHKRIYAGMTGEVVDFNLKKERLPEDKDGAFLNAVMPTAFTAK